jgi:hypothetical protein
MNLRDLINRLDKINEDANNLTLQGIQSIEKAAMDKAVADKAKGGWTGFTTWDPRSAGNIALAKLAQQHHFEGLFNSEGDFVIAFGDKTWSSGSELHPGGNPRIAPPSPDDWKPLALLGLVPQNAKGPAGLTNWLSGGKAQKEFDDVKKQSAAAALAKQQPAASAQDAPAQDSAAVATPVEEPAKAVTTTLNPLTKEVPGEKPDGEASQTSTAPQTAANPEEQKEVDDLDKEVDNLLSQNDSEEESEKVTEDIYGALVESFGYQKKKFDESEDFNFPIPFGNSKNGAAFGNPLAQFRADQSPLKDLSIENFDLSTPIIEIDGTDIYNFKDLLIDLGFAAGTVVVATLAAPAAAVGGAVVGVNWFVRLLIRIANSIRKWASMHKAAGTLEREAISKLVKSYKEGFANSVMKNFAGKALAGSTAATTFINGVVAWAEKHTGKGAGEIQVDPMGNPTGMSMNETPRGR